MIATLEAKQSNKTEFLKNSNASKLLNFLPQRVKSLASISNEDVIRRMGKFIPVTSNVLSLLEAQGYKGDKAEVQAESYRVRQKELVYRDNFFFNTLQSLLKSEPQIESLTSEQFELLQKMITFCMERIGYVK